MTDTTPEWNPWPCTRQTAIARLRCHAEQLHRANPDDEMAAIMATASWLLAQKPPPEVSLQWHAWPAETPLTAGLGSGPLLVTMDPEGYGYTLREAFFLEGCWCWPDGRNIVDSDIRLFTAMPAHPATIEGGETRKA